jgi:hypothetical protein
MSIIRKKNIFILKKLAAWAAFSPIKEKKHFFTKMSQWPWAE